MKYLVMFLLLISFLSCKQYKQKCESFLLPKVEAMANKVAVDCECDVDHVKKLFLKFPKKLCALKKPREQLMDGLAERDGNYQAVCQSVKELALDFVGQYLADKLKCKINLNKCLNNGKIDILIDNYICAAI